MSALVKNNTSNKNMIGRYYRILTNFAEVSTLKNPYIYKMAFDILNEYNNYWNAFLF